MGAQRYDETAAAMIAQLKYGAGTPFYRLEQLEKQLGIPLPAATQWEIVEEAAQLIKPARDELIRQAAQGTVVHNDDTSMRVLRLKRDPSDERTGVFTSGIVSVGQDWKIALYFTGGLHAGENIAGLLKQRLLAVFAAFEREILGERVGAGLAHARQNGTRLGRPLTAGLHAGQVRKLHRSGLSKSEISRRLNIGRTSVRRILYERTGS